MLDPAFLAILRCPATREPLGLLTSAELERLNRAIARGTVANQIGVTLTAPCDAGLINASRSLIYAVWNDIPQLVANEALPGSAIGFDG